MQWLQWDERGTTKPTGRAEECLGGMLKQSGCCPWSRCSLLDQSCYLQLQEDVNGWGGLIRSSVIPLTYFPL